MSSDQSYLGYTADQMREYARAAVLAAQPVSKQPAKDDLYFLQDSRSYVGNCPLWWAKGGNGYTTRINLAHRYTKEQAFAQHKRRKTDIPWPCSMVEPLQNMTIDVQDLHKTNCFAEKELNQMNKIHKYNLEVTDGPVSEQPSPQIIEESHAQREGAPEQGDKQ